jgi:hypothetical protein
MWDICRCNLPWADDPDEAAYANFRYNLPCRLSDNALPGYYNASATVADVFGTTQPYRSHYRTTNPGSGEHASRNNLWKPRDDVAGVHMVQVQCCFSDICLWIRAVSSHACTLPLDV